MAKWSAAALQILVDLIVALGLYRQRGSKTLKDVRRLSKTTLSLASEDVKMYLQCSDQGACLSCYMKPLPLSWRIQGLFELCARIACVTLLLQMQCHRHVWMPHRWCENNCVLLRFFASFYMKTQGRVGDVACPF